MRKRRKKRKKRTKERGGTSAWRWSPRRPRRAGQRRAAQGRMTVTQT
jgi:hypothetical protein